MISMKRKIKKSISVFLAGLVCITAFGTFKAAAAGPNGVTGNYSVPYYFSIHFGSSCPASFANRTLESGLAINYDNNVYTSYCMDINSYAANPYTSSTSVTNQTLVNSNSDKKKWIKDALTFGFTGNTKYTGVSGDSAKAEYEATQILVWNIVYGIFDVATPSVESNDEQNIVKCLPAAAQTIYANIRANMLSYDIQYPTVTAPSFASFDSNSAPTTTLTYSPSNNDFEATLDFSNYTLDSQSSVTATDMGNNQFKLSVASSTSLSTAAFLSASFTGPSKVLAGAVYGDLLFWNHDGGQSLVSFSPTKVYFNVKTQDVGSLKITKTADDNMVSGVVFTISKDGSPVATVKTGADGTVTVDHLPLATYTVSEQSVPGRYVDPGSQEVTVTQSGIAAVTFNNKLTGMQIVKTSEDGQKSGFTFTISGDGITKTVTTDSNGIATAYVPAGSYTVTETNVPSSYSVPASQTVTVTQSGILTVNFNNKLTGMQIVKTSEDGQKSGFTFTITGDGITKTVTTDSDGIATANIPAGSYTVTETNVPSSYSVPASQTVTVTQSGILTVNFNNKLTGMQIVKTAEDGQKSGFTFTISSDGITKTVTTDSDGIATAYVPAGSYTVTETNVPERYIAPASQTVTVTQSGILTVNFTNKLNLVPIPEPDVPKAPAPSDPTTTTTATTTPTVTIPDGIVPLAASANPKTSDNGAQIPLYAALASLLTLTGVGVKRKIRKSRQNS